MTDLSQIRVTWSGSPVVGGGVSTFYAVDDPAAVVTALDVFFGSIKSLFPATTSIRVAQSGVVIDSNTGDVTGAWAGGLSTPQTSAAAGGYAAGVGARIRWNTAGIRNGRHVVGSTYLVPLLSIYYDTSGTIDDTAVGGTIRNAINTLLGGAGAQLIIYSRPTAENPNGVEHSITSGECVDKVSWLRTRRT